MTSTTNAPQTWHLQHSDHQVVALLEGELVATRRLKRREIELFRQRVEDGTIDDEDLYWRTPVDDINLVVADNARRRIVVVTNDRELEIRGFTARSNRQAVRRWAALDEHDPQSPGSPASQAANHIASAARLNLASDPRSEVLHYNQEPEPAAIHAAASESTQVRPWAPAAYAGFGAIWMFGWYLLTRRWLGDLADDAQTLITLAFLVTIVASMAASAVMVFALSITVDASGIRGVSLVRHRKLEWSEIAVVHSISDRQSMRGRRRVQVVKANGKAATLPVLTKKQVSRLAAAMTIFGRPHGVTIDLPSGDFSSRYGITQSQAPSVIAIKILWWRL